MIVESSMEATSTSHFNLSIFNLNTLEGIYGSTTTETVYPISYKTHNNDQYLICGLSNYSLFCMDINTFKPINLIKQAHEKKINDIFVDDNIIYSCSNDGTIKLWDIRDFSAKAMVISKNNREIYSVAKTQFILGGGSQSQIYFWDLRSMKSLTTFSETFSDDVTKIKFHEKKANCLLCGSEDGILCLYDLSQNNEEDAIASITRLTQPISTCDYFVSNPDYALVTTTVDTINAVSLEETRVLCDINTIENLDTNTEYLIEAFTHPKNMDVYYLKGDQEGTVKSFKINLENDKSKENLYKFNTLHKKVIRGGKMITEDILLTTGEDGTIQATKGQKILNNYIDFESAKNEMFSTSTNNDTFNKKV